MNIDSYSTRSPHAALTPIDTLIATPPGTRACDRPAQPFGDPAPVALADAGEHDEELLAAEAVDELEGVQALAQLIGDVAQRGVAARMAVLVVDRLEVVDVAQQQAHRLAGQARLMAELGEARDQRVAVEQAGQRIDDRLVAMVQLGGLKRPDDRDDADEQRERGDQRGGVVERPCGWVPKVAASTIAIVSARPAITTCGRKRAAVIAAGSAIHGSATLRGPPLSATPPPISSHRDDDRARAHALGMGARVDAPLDVGEVDGRQGEQRERPPADPWRGGQQGKADGARADHADRAHALVRVDDAAAVALCRAQPGPPFHATAFDALAASL